MVNELGLYVHWPWCVRKCPYCDFNSHALHVSVDRSQQEMRYIEALLEDLKQTLTLVRAQPITSIFFGGGTPSLMSEAGFDRLMNGIAKQVVLAEDCEITMEANPGTIESGNLRAYAQSGVNRFSLGVQSFDDRFLKILGRIHSQADVWRSIEAVSQTVDNFNLDVMYALPGQCMQDLKQDLDCAISAGASHLSFYELTIEEGTAFAKRLPEGLPDGDDAADMGDVVHDVLDKAGFHHYEISGYAKPGCYCRHNQTYWTFGDYLGIGAGAHGKMTTDQGIVRTERVASPSLYMKSVLQNHDQPITKSVPVSHLPFEFMLNALRLTDGVETARWTQTTGQPLSMIAPMLQVLRQEKLLVSDEKRIQPTELGRRFLSDVQERFLPEYF